jgi:hypothetical protein
MRGNWAWGFYGAIGFLCGLLIEEQPKSILAMFSITLAAECYARAVER